MRSTRRVATAAAVVAVGLLAPAGPVGAGVAPQTMTVDPNPAVTGETVTVTNVQPCPNPGAVSMVELLVDGPVSDDILNTTADAEGDWTFTFPAGEPGTYVLTVSCVYVQSNVVYVAETLVVQAPASTTSTTAAVTTTTTGSSTTATTQATTSTTRPPAPAPVVVAQPSFTG